MGTDPCIPLSSLQTKEKRRGKSDYRLQSFCVSTILEMYPFVKSKNLIFIIEVSDGKELSWIKTNAPPC